MDLKKAGSSRQLGLFLPPLSQLCSKDGRTDLRDWLRSRWADGEAYVPCSHCHRWVAGWGLGGWSQRQQGRGPDCHACPGRAGTGLSGKWEGMWETQDSCTSSMCWRRGAKVASWPCPAVPAVLTEWNSQIFV